MQFASIGFDENKLFSFKEGETLCHNPFEISMQAMLGKKVMEEYKGVSNMLISRYYPIDDLPDVTQDEYAITAKDWLLHNARDIGSALIIDYDFDANYAGENVYTPWHSAFGQAYFVLALLYWGMWTQDEQYNQLAQKAARGLLLDINRGGCSIERFGEIWFEEMPQKNRTHIFNAHLISMVALLELKRKLNLSWVTSYIESALVAFLKCANQMDSGISSVYDMPASYEGFLQLVPDDPAHDIWIHDITVTDAQRTKHLDLSVDTSFEPNDEMWVAGIDWSEQDEDGYRKLLFGAALHPCAVNGGTRQNTYLHVKEISTKREVWEIRINYRCEYDTCIHLYRNDGRGGFCDLGFENTVMLKAGEGSAAITLPVVVLISPVHQSYHYFHITLLEEITKLTGNTKFEWLIRKFRDYNDKDWLYQRANMKSPSQLTSISVTVNSRCGLFCKMCDIGIENSKASIFKNLRGSRNQEIDTNLLVERCLEARPTLTSVHFVGTEVTLHKPFPQIVKKLRDAGLEVLATTNGIALGSMLTQLLDAQLSCLYISIDGPADIHDKIRGKKGLFRDIIKVLEDNRARIEQAKEEYGFRLRVGCAITPMSYQHLPSLIEALKGSLIDGVDCTHMNFVLPQTVESYNQKHGRYPTGESCTYPEMAPEIVSPYIMRSKLFEATELAQQIGIEFTSVPQMKSYLEFEDFYKRPWVCTGAKRCSVANRHLQISADGSVCVMSRCYQFAIGNMRDYTLHELFHSKAMIDFRQHMENGLYEPCYHCCGIME